MKTFDPGLIDSASAAIQMLAGATLLLAGPLMMAEMGLTPSAVAAFARPVRRAVGFGLFAIGRRFVKAGAALML